MFKTISTQTTAKLLSQGKVVAIPTETVYGLAAVFDNEAAVNTIFKIKNRPLDHPLILHMADFNNIDHYAKNIPAYVAELAKAFSPGPLTFVLHKAQKIPGYITGNQDTVAIRVPNHDKTLSVLKKLNKPIVAPSANPYCQISPTCSAHVHRYFKEMVPILEGGQCDIGIESTIILATNPSKITILRPGIISAQQISDVSNITCESINNNKIKFSGNKKVHYAPKSPLLLFNTADEIKSILSQKNKKYCCLLIDNMNIFSHFKIMLPKNPHDYAKSIYRILHEVDTQYDAILVQRPPKTSLWSAIYDRLKKAGKSI